MDDIMKLHLPTILKSGQAKNEWTRVMDGASEHGQVFVITGTQNKAVVVMDLSQFEKWRKSYADVVKELETMRALENEETKEALERASKDDLPQDRSDFVTASEVKKHELSGRC